MVRFDSNQITVLLSQDQFDEVVAAVLAEIGTVTSLGTEIADPGDGNEIAPASHGHVVLNGVGDETRDLAPPEFVGQELMLTADNPGDSIAVMAPAIINGSGDQIITFTGQAQTIHLRAISIGSSPTWRVLVNDGCTLSPAE